MKKIEKYDVVVLGCGVAGLAATLTASRKGARVLVVEKTDSIGGNATQSYVGTICGLYYRRRNQDFSYCSERFMAEFANRVRVVSGIEPIAQQDGLAYLPYRPEAMKMVMQAFLIESKVEVAFSSHIHHYGISGSRIVECEIGNLSGNQVIETSSVVDAGGNAETTLSQQLGFLDDPNPQQAHLSVAFSFEPGKSKAWLECMYAIRKAEMNGELTPALALASAIPGLEEPDKIWIKVPVLSRIISVGNQEVELKQEALRNAASLTEVLRKYAPMFKNTQVVEVANRVGIRTEARNKGRNVLSADDVLSGRKKEGEFARGTWPVEIWKAGKAVQLEYPEYDDYYTIDNQVLWSEQIDNLFFAGRSISADSIAIASARVMGTCLQTGEQAANLATHT